MLLIGFTILEEGILLHPDVSLIEFDGFLKSLILLLFLRLRHPFKDGLAVFKIVIVCLNMVKQSGEQCFQLFKGHRMGILCCILILQNTNQFI